MGEIKGMGELDGDRTRRIFDEAHQRGGKARCPPTPRPEPTAQAPACCSLVAFRALRKRQTSTVLAPVAAPSGLILTGFGGRGALGVYHEALGSTGAEHTPRASAARGAFRQPLRAPERRRRPGGGG